MRFQISFCTRYWIANARPKKLVRAKCIKNSKLIQYNYKDETKRKKKKKKIIYSQFGMGLT